MQLRCNGAGRDDPGEIVAHDTLDLGRTVGKNGSGQHPLYRLHRDPAGTLAALLHPPRRLLVELAGSHTYRLGR